MMLKHHFSHISTTKCFNYKSKQSCFAARDGSQSRLKNNMCYSQKPRASGARTEVFPACVRVQERHFSPHDWSVSRPVIASRLDRTRLERPITPGWFTRRQENNLRGPWSLQTGPWHNKLSYIAVKHSEEWVKHQHESIYRKHELNKNSESVNTDYQHLKVKKKSIISKELNWDEVKSWLNWINII